MARRKSKRKLDAAEWSAVFRLRCRSKSGSQLSPEELDLCKAAMEEDPKRYSGMNSDVFDATVPFGSSAKARR